MQNRIHQQSMTSSVHSSRILEREREREGGGGRSNVPQYSKHSIFY